MINSNTSFVCISIQFSFLTPWGRKDPIKETYVLRNPSHSSSGHLRVQHRGHMLCFAFSKQPFINIKTILSSQAYEKRSRASAVFKLKCPLNTTRPRLPCLTDGAWRVVRRGGWVGAGYTRHRPLKWLVRKVSPCLWELLVRKIPLKSKIRKQCWLLSETQVASAVGVPRRGPVVWKSTFGVHNAHKLSSLKQHKFIL